MSHHGWLQFFAYITLIGAAFVVIVDLLVEFGVRVALRVWGSLLYHAVRYLAVGSAIILALNVIL